MPVLTAREVVKTFQEGREEVHVLRGVSLDLHPADELSRYDATADEVTVDGVRVDPTRPERLPAIRRKSIGFVFQQFNLFPALTAVENVEYALNVKGIRGPEARTEAETLIDAVGLSDRRDFLPRDLSGGQKQRIAIARALCNSPAVLLADEPTANLDSQVGSQVLELFRGLARRENRALLIVTHDPRVRSVCDRVLRIADGNLLPESRIAA